MDRVVGEQLARLDRLLASVPEPQMRRGLAIEWLTRAPAADACAVLAAALDRPLAADPLRRAISEVMTGATGTRLPEETRRHLYAEAARIGSDEIRRLLRSTAARDRIEEPVRLLSRELAELPLGRRRALARGGHAYWLERLARDCDPIVIANLLANPRTVEADVLRIAASRPAAAAVLVEISKSARWSTRVPIRKALARNPYCPVSVAAGIVASLPLEDLREMRGDADLHAETRAQIAAELARRARVP